MEVPEALAVIEALAEGFDPQTGATLPENGPYHQPRVIRALYTVVKELRRLPGQAPRPTVNLANAGQPWTKSEDEQLHHEFAAQTTIPDIARRHQRTRVAILARLMRLGLLRRHDSNSAASATAAMSTTHATKSRSRAGKPWTVDEDAELLSAFDAGVKVDRIAERLQRGVYAAEVRLCKLGRRVDTVGGISNKARS